MRERLRGARWSVSGPDSLVDEAAITYDLALCHARAMQPMTEKAASRRRKSVTRLRRDAVIAAAKEAGLLSGTKGWVAGRISKQLVKAAKARSAITSDTELLEYALARVELEDDFGQNLIARKGHVPRDIDIEF
jgi:hypothetical protein